MNLKKISIINALDEKLAKEQLEIYYKKGLIPAEKKNYLSKLRSSRGPFMGIESEEDEDGHFMLDAASQIATLGLGFNPTPFFGVSHFLESWTNDNSTFLFKHLDFAFHQVIKRYLQLPNKENIFLTYTNSGAEANEIALGECFRKRKKAKASKVLAFEGSFHGRMLVTLAATWNKAKREPFEWPQLQAVYCPYPELNLDQIDQKRPEGWAEFWENSSVKIFSIPSVWDNSDKELQKEIDCLMAIRHELLKEEIYALIIEPMQCEGGDRYASGRFFEALLQLSRSFDVPVIFDEVQTGFHLGREFFWHKQFNLKDSNSLELRPDYIVCAKKAQVGIVIAWQKCIATPEFQVASVMRGYIHAVMLGQLTDKILEIENITRTKCEKLVNKYKDFLERPRAKGISFALEVKTAELTNLFINKRFERGLLYYLAGDRTLRFRLNTAFTKNEIDFLFEQLDNLCQEIFLGNTVPKPLGCKTSARKMEEIYNWHELILQLQLNQLESKPNSFQVLLKQVSTFFKGQGKLVLVTKDNFKDYAKQILKLQKKIYEPARQTPLKLFQKTINAKNYVALVLEKKGALKAIAFGAPPAEYPLESALRADPDFNDPHTLYMIDLTVDGSEQEKGLGKNLKYAVAAFAIHKGFKKINGKNRDLLARQMLAINLSLGSIEQFFRKEHYLDFEKSRDLFYYTTHLQFNSLPMSLSEMINIPIGSNSLNMPFIKEQLPYLVNKVCLSNFVGKRFLKQIDELFAIFPEGLRSGYTTSGLSECLDKVVKSIWVTGRKKTKLLTFAGHYFGQGSNLSHSLSNPSFNYFKVDRVAHPDNLNQDEVLVQVENILKEDETLGIFLEPLPQNILKPIPLSFLKRLKALGIKYKSPIVYNESASQKFNYSKNFYFAGNNLEITPDAMICFFGGQAGLVAVKKELFLEKPLMMISTWDGDEFSFANYHYSMNLILESKVEYLKCKEIFEKNLVRFVKKYNAEIEITNGVGTIKGHLPFWPKNNLKSYDGKYLVLPSWDAMKSFLSIAR